jgi:hypothetical protein
VAILGLAMVHDVGGVAQWPFPGGKTIAGAKPFVAVGLVVIIAAVLLTVRPLASARWTFVALTLAAAGLFAKRVEVLLMHPAVVPPDPQVMGAVAMDAVSAVLSGVLAICCVVAAGSIAGPRWFSAAVQRSEADNARPILIQAVSRIKASGGQPLQLPLLLTGRVAGAGGQGRNEVLSRASLDRWRSAAAAMAEGRGAEAGWIDLLTLPYDEVRRTLASDDEVAHSPHYEVLNVLEHEQLAQNIRALRPHLVRHGRAMSRRHGGAAPVELRRRNLLLLLATTPETEVPVGGDKSSVDLTAEAVRALPCFLANPDAVLAGEPEGDVGFEILVARPRCLQGEAFEDYNQTDRALREALALLAPDHPPPRSGNRPDYFEAWSALLGGDDLVPSHLRSTSLHGFLGLRRDFVPTSHLCIDVSSGRRLLPIVAAVLTMNSGALFSYVPPSGGDGGACDHGDGPRAPVRILVFDGQIGFSNPAATTGG